MAATRNNPRLCLITALLALVPAFTFAEDCSTTNSSLASATSSASAGSTPALNHPGFQLLETPTIEVAETYTRVSLAKVLLDIGQLSLKSDGSFTGTYSLTVPLRHSKDESGAIRLPLPKDCPFETLLNTGGTMHGVGKSPREDLPPRDIEATVLPDPAHPGCGKLLLTIDTGAHILHFESTYSVSQPVSTVLDHSMPADADVAGVIKPGQQG